MNLIADKAALLGEGVREGLPSPCLRSPCQFATDHVGYVKMKTKQKFLILVTRLVSWIMAAEHNGVEIDEEIRYSDEETKVRSR